MGGQPAAGPDRRIRRSDRHRSGQRLLLPRRSTSTIRYLLAQDGLAPSESNPQFHQQMVYAVAMTTIRHFERALGREALWADRESQRPNGEHPASSSCAASASIRTRCGMRNAYYSPTKKALLFGYFPGTTKDAGQHAGHARLHLPVARHRRARDDARAARRRAPAVQRADQSRRPGVPRGLRRHRRAVPALHLSGGAREPDPAHPRRSAQREPARTARAAVRARDRTRRRAARRARRRHDAACGSRESPIRTPSTRAVGASRARRDSGRRGVRRVRAALSRPLRGPVPDRDPGHRTAAGRGHPSRTSRTGWPPKRPEPPTRSCRCASARSTTVRRSTSRSAIFCAAWSPAISTTLPPPTGAAGSSSSRASGSGASIREASRAWGSTRWRGRAARICSPA